MSYQVPTAGALGAPAAGHGAAHTSPGAAAALQQHQALLAALQRPGACAGFAGEARLLQTPISSLLLAGDRVFKLKKPVRLGFADFSTLEARHQACLQELRLNQRTAARWYQAVVPVRQHADGASVGTVSADRGDAAPVVDWAVQMRRFDDHQRFDRLAEHDALSPDQVDALVQAVSRFHAQLPPAPPGYGRPEGLRHWARENLLELQTLLAAPEADAWGETAMALAAAVALLQPWTEREGERLAPLMALRARTGHVREVHGDLHLANIAWADGAPLLFDALEFNDTLRHTDTLGDLAFSFMDLLVVGQPRLAWRFISAALEASGDHAALPLLPWWSVYRAAVRAKVALLGAAGPAASADGAALGAVADGTGPALARAGRNLSVALALAGLPEVVGLAEPAGGWQGLRGAPRLLLCAGLSGSGKTTVAGWLAQRLGAVRLRSDVERKRLYGLSPTARAAPSVGLYSPEATRRTYERLGELAAQALAAGIPVVVDAAALQHGERQALRTLADAHGARYGQVWCEAPPAVLVQRLDSRAAAGHDASDATTAVLARQQGFAQAPGDDEAGCTLRLDTDVQAAALAQRCEQLVLPG